MIALIAPREDMVARKDPLPVRHALLENTKASLKLLLVRASVPRGSTPLLLGRYQTKCASYAHQVRFSTRKDP